MEMSYALVDLDIYANNNNLLFLEMDENNEMVSMKLFNQNSIDSEIFEINQELETFVYIFYRKPNIVLSLRDIRNNLKTSLGHYESQDDVMNHLCILLSINFNQNINYLINQIADQEMLKRYKSLPKKKPETVKDRLNALAIKWS